MGADNRHSVSLYLLNVQALPKKEIDKVEKHVFRVYDTNGDGFIDFIEFMVLFHILSGKTLDS